MTRLAKDMETLVAFLDEVEAASAFSLATIPASAAKHWSMTAGVLTHDTGGFFHIVGLKDHRTGQEDLMFYQPQSALNGVVVHRADGRFLVLVHARVEPGNSRIVNLGPTVQSTAGNYLRLHGGRRTAYHELFHTYAPQVSPRFVSTQLDLGQFYYLKQKTLSVVEADTLIPTAETFIWVDLDVLSAAARQDHIINTDLRAVLAAIPWGSWTPGKADAADSAIRIPGPVASTLGDREMVPIAALSDWEVDEFGIHDTRISGRSVLFHDVKSRGREVDHWYQPLMHLRDRLVAELAVRGEGSRREYLVTFGEEFGFPGRELAMPSVSGVERTLAPTEGQTLHECVQSEEGGRFHKVETRYRVVQVDPGHAAASGQAWLTADALRKTLQASNRASLPLRCVSSLVLGDLHPGVVG
ncbi:NDP-hexose 2,3-dehydratase family protein [Maricaulis sp.]|uniref:NDP-hexose 2,3-dehydratase family protein n=1 Tax=Maricaulis sp. TaxID=1486257 RepID=UPI0025BEDD65|nr:NDP-hexose 2,3-dehydratase family protein [Maricaulis sp.]